MPKVDRRIQGTAKVARRIQGRAKVARRIQGIPEGSAAYPGQGVTTENERDERGKMND